MHPFLELCREVSSKTRSAAFPEESEPEYQRVLDYIRAHPEERSFIADAFCHGLIGRDGPAPADIYLTRFCMRTPKWPEVKAATEVAYNDGGNLWYAAEVRKLLAIYGSKA
jgi:hypothetical protein